MFNMTFDEAFRHRVSLIEAEIALAEEELSKKRERLAELQNIIDSMPEAMRKMTISEARAVRASPSGKRLPKGQIKRLVLEVLGNQMEGLDALTILEMINSKASKPYLRTSLSPQLSRLKDDGYIVLEGKIWKLKKIEPLDVDSSKDSSKGSDINPAKDREAGSGGGI